MSAERPIPGGDGKVAIVGEGGVRQRRRRRVGDVVMQPGTIERTLLFLRVAPTMQGVLGRFRRTINPYVCVLATSHKVGRAPTYKCSCHNRVLVADRSHIEKLPEGTSHRES